MKKNESVVDQGIRSVAGILLLVLYLTGVLTGTLGIIAVVLGGILLVTGVIGFCPLYALLKIRTNR